MVLYLFISRMEPFFCAHLCDPCRTGRCERNPQTKSAALRQHAQIISLNRKPAKAYFTSSKSIYSPSVVVVSSRLREEPAKPATLLLFLVVLLVAHLFLLHFLHAITYYAGSF